MYPPYLNITVLQYYSVSFCCSLLIGFLAVIAIGHVGMGILKVSSSSEKDVCNATHWKDDSIKSGLYVLHKPKLFMSVEPESN